MSPYELRERTDRYWAMTARVVDERALKALHDLADKYRTLADEIEAREESGDKGAPR
jgi:hypothetical protein